MKTMISKLNQIESNELEDKGNYLCTSTRARDCCVIALSQSPSYFSNKILNSITQVEKVCSPNSSAAPADDGADHVGGNEEPEREVHRSTSTSSGTRSLLWKMVIRMGTVGWTICLSTSQFAGH